MGDGRHLDGLRRRHSHVACMRGDTPLATAVYTGA
jgi:hypothetical protein